MAKQSNKADSVDLWKVVFKPTLQVLRKHQAYTEADVLKKFIEDIFDRKIQYHEDGEITHHRIWRKSNKRNEEI